MLRTTCLAFAMLTATALFAQDAIESGPKKGAFMAKPFECYNVNGPAKGRPHCLVCKFGLYPAVLIFAKEPAEGKDEAFTDLLAKLDEVVADFDERNFQAGVVILSPDARDSTNNADAKKADVIIEEAVKRDKLYERLTKRTEKLKHVIVGTYRSDGEVVTVDPPKGYKINPKAEVTVIFYERMKVVENFAFETLEAKDVEMTVKKIREGLAPKAKTAPK